MTIESRGYRPNYESERKGFEGENQFLPKMQKDMFPENQLSWIMSLEHMVLIVSFVEVVFFVLMAME